MSGKDERERLASLLREAGGIIEVGDTRLMASDGDAGGRPPDISLREWRRLYVCIESAEKLLAALREREPREQSMVESARAYALRAHGDQGYGPMPWAWHFDHVAELASRHGERAQVLAYLHDVLEDTSVTFDDLVEEFGRVVAEEVEMLSDPSGTRKERHAGMCARMRTAPAHVVTVKACDRLVNVRASYEFAPDLLSMYRKERETFRAATEHAAPAWMLDQIDALLAEPQPEREPVPLIEVRDRGRCREPALSRRQVVGRGGRKAIPTAEHGRHSPRARGR